MTALAITLTLDGIAAAINAANTGTGPLVISQIALLSGPTTEIKRITTLGGEAIADNIIHVTITDETADTYTLTGLRLITDGGIIFATYHQASPILEKGAEQLVLLSADILLTSVPPGSVTIGGTGFQYPPATTTRQGVIEIATDAEVQTGTDTTRALTPAGLNAAAATTAPAMNGTAAVGTAKRWARADHVHPSDTSKANTSGTYAGLNVGNADTVDGWHRDDIRNFASLLNKPSTLGGYGITDALPLSGGTITGTLYVASAAEAQVHAVMSGQSTAYLFSNAGEWGLYSAAGGALVRYVRASGKAYVGGVDTSLIVQNNSGTYSINITGNAETVDGWNRDDIRAWGNLLNKPAGADIAFNWSGQPGQPAWLWGANDAGNTYVYNPSNFSVAHATSAGTAAYVTNITTAQVLAAIAGASAGAVGTYVFGTINGGGVAFGGVYAGSSIIPSGVYHTSMLALDTAGSGNSSALVTGGGYLWGSWRAMGTENHNTGTQYARATLFLRIA